MAPDFPRLLLVSVGTSIYSSLCWDPEAFHGKPFYDSYAEWVTISDLVDKPRLRTQRVEIEDLLKEVLTANNAIELAKHIHKKQWSNQFFRYSAELTTILKLAYKKGPGRAEEWIRESEISFIYDRNCKKAGCHVAGLHNAEAIRSWAEAASDNIARPIVVKDLESESPDDFQVAQVRVALEAQKRASEYLALNREVYYVASGGFKITGCLLGLSLPQVRPPNRVHLVYQHEGSGSIFLLDVGQAGIYVVQENDQEHLVPHTGDPQ